MAAGKAWRNRGEWKDQMRRLWIGMMMCLGACHARSDRPALATRAQLAEVEGAVSRCTAATGRLTPLIARGRHDDLAHVAVDARNRCSSARAVIAKIVGPLPSIEVCRRDVDAQERVSIAELAVLDGSTPDRRAAVVHALDEAIGLQDQCAAAVASLRRGG
jgi:hypothetical protein